MIAPLFGVWKKSIISWEMWCLQWLQAGVILKTYLQYSGNWNVYIHDFFFSHVHCFVVVVSLTFSKTLSSRTSLSETMIKEMEEMRKDNETLRSMVKVYQVMEL